MLRVLTGLEMRLDLPVSQPGVATAVIDSCEPPDVNAGN